MEFDAILLKDGRKDPECAAIKVVGGDHRDDH